ncbi:MAG: hypothetical protein A2W93_05545 [Bacteroidetes bacterium GWF2_43_63]|nr:MAG: hypothetical protein A2W94_07520 [Bacteroidetes bacterium GWE2_42_42]OFY55481.1 MAG: hypothetical protein A2W93_05545 [Bacteroidetes bacterium GWF2_43_63]HBG69956.1 hypothetical protein [Bacteroidales bacterium]HCB62618.1 hypothetical protein [Bacteroidales bacterium]HCY23738.1 hypothetical protein [Bacteroidales bacterium]
MKTLTFVFAFILILNCQAQTDSIRHEKNDTIKGMRWAFLPVAAFDSDLGLKYGAIVTAYQFGDGLLYPDYIYNISYEFDRTTKGAVSSQLFFDSGKLMKRGKHRIVADFSIIHEQATDFYGFNGSASTYTNAFEDENSDRYISRMYYKFDRNLLRLTADWHEQLNDNWVVFGGIHHYGYKQKSVDIDKLNKGKDAVDMLPDTITLFDYYSEVGVIDSVQADGGNVTAIRAGIVFDTRDVQFNPTKGHWLEALIAVSPKLPWVESPFVKASVILRNYLPLYGKKLTLASRLAWQDALGKQAPFYYMSYVSQSFCNNTIAEGLGGAKTLRGVLRNRIWADGFFYGNVELRWSVANFRAINQKIEIKLSPFYDFGMVTDPVNFSLPELMLNNYPPLSLTTTKDTWHHGTGAGVHFIMNDNFILSVDYGFSLKSNDGSKGLYLGTGFLF